MGKVSGFEFRREYYEIARCMNAQDRLNFYETMMRRVFDDGTSPSKTVSAALELVKSQLDKDAKKTTEPVVIYVR